MNLVLTGYSVFLLVKSGNLYTKTLDYRVQDEGSSGESWEKKTKILYREKNFWLNMADKNTGQTLGRKISQQILTHVT